MISREEIENLAQLSRLHLTEKEVGELQKDFGAILEYVGQIKKVGEGSEDLAALHNIMREDIERRSDDLLFSKQEKILEAAPKREDDYIVVRKIIARDEPEL